MRYKGQFYFKYTFPQARDLFLKKLFKFSMLRKNKIIYCYESLLLKGSFPRKYLFK